MKHPAVADWVTEKEYPVRFLCDQFGGDPPRLLLYQGTGEGRQREHPDAYSRMIKATLDSSRSSRGVRVSID